MGSYFVPTSIPLFDLNLLGSSLTSYESNCIRKSKVNMDTWQVSRSCAQLVTHPSQEALKIRYQLFCLRRENSA